MSPRSFRLVADDYGLSPGVSRAIRMLIQNERLSGTGCMTLFPDWKESARELREIAAPAEIGLHLTLTDFAALSSDESLPPLKQLLAGLARGTIKADTIARELDAQLDRFTEEFGRLPAYLDGHQHVHFLKPVRLWLRDKFRDASSRQRPWVRGSPTLKGAPPSIWPKIAFVKGLATGFDREMADVGLRVRGPLAGFYQWRKNGLFEKALESMLLAAPAGAVIMCHPGFVDDVLRARDVLTEAREEELRVLSGDAFANMIQRYGQTLARVSA